MHRDNSSYNRFALVGEMLDSVGVVENFDTNVVRPFAESIGEVRRLFLSGEGSSRIFPAKNAVHYVMQMGSKFPVVTESGRQAMEYDLDGWAVFGASNSGKTKETLSLMHHLKKAGNKHRYGLTNQKDTPLEALCEKTHILTCGNETAVAATKSVVEQALFYQVLVAELMERPIEPQELKSAAEKLEETLLMEIPLSIVRSLVRAKRVYFAGRNNGVAEELTLKANEIARYPSTYLENTYAVHGIEEVMTQDEIVILVEPYKDELNKFKEVLEDGVGMTLIAVATEELSVPTIVIPACSGFDSFMQLAAGWNLLVEVGLMNKVDMDKPARARKIGNESLLSSIAAL